jgi:hypothetical protein
MKQGLVYVRLPLATLYKLSVASCNLMIFFFRPSPFRALPSQPRLLKVYSHNYILDSMLSCHQFIMHSTNRST